MQPQKGVEYEHLTGQKGSNKPTSCTPLKRGVGGWVFGRVRRHLAMTFTPSRAMLRMELNGGACNSPTEPFSPGNFPEVCCLQKIFRPLPFKPQDRFKRLSLWQSTDITVKHKEVIGKDAKKRGRSAADEKKEVKKSDGASPAKRGRGRPKGSTKKKSKASPKKASVAGRGRGRPKREEKKEDIAVEDEEEDEDEEEEEGDE
uniref:Uncharacterized protein n=1 Tax=Timema monikensis TaxID=170555 RepID=A0A7R9EHA1_9NEOP|nr:unnamed protein product [Timema monikensis]